jgi:retron-type reverse transcriptase
MKIQLEIKYEDIISEENLFAAWREFLVGKKNKKDVQEFGKKLTDNILQLHQDLADFSYLHGNYYAFNISDPKPRIIHKASVRDRVLHHAIYRLLYPFFERTFVSDSFSCRINKGVHKGTNRFREFGRIASQNGTKTCWVLKCDIRKFFANIDHRGLLEILENKIPDTNILWLLKNVIDSFSSAENKGLPLGNLTSQLFCNIYMNEFDKFVKHGICAKWYARYADDFVLLSEDRHWLELQLSRISNFLESRLKLTLHPDKVFIKTFASGVDFLGWIHFPKHRVARTQTKNRMLKRIGENPTNETFQSYLGLLKHGNAKKLEAEIKNLYWLLGDQI